MSTLDKDSSVTLRGMLALPPKRFRLFMIASIDSTWIPPTGGNGRPAETGRKGDRDRNRTGTTLQDPRTGRVLPEDLGQRGSGVCRPPDGPPMHDRSTRHRLPVHDAAERRRGRLSSLLHPVGGTVQSRGGTTWSRSGESATAPSKRTTSDNAPDVVKVHLQGEGEGGEHHQAEPPQRTALQEVLEEEAALARLRAVFPEAKEIS